MGRNSYGYTETLPNGNRVTVTVGSTRKTLYKRVSVRYPDGSQRRESYSRGPLGAYLLGAYSADIPRWARAPEVPIAPPIKTKRNPQVNKPAKARSAATTKARAAKTPAGSAQVKAASTAKSPPPSRSTTEESVRLLTQPLPPDLDKGYKIIDRRAPRE